VKNDPDRAGRQGARVRVTCRGLSGNFLSWWHVLRNSIQYIPYIQVSNVGRLNYVYTYKCSTFTSIKGNSLSDTPYKNLHSRFPKLLSSTQVCAGQGYLPGCVVQIFVRVTLLHNIIKYILYTQKLLMLVVLLHKCRTFTSTKDNGTHITMCQKILYRVVRNVRSWQKCVWVITTYRVCRVNVCHSDMFYLALLSTFTYTKVMTVDHLNYVYVYKNAIQLTVLKPVLHTTYCTKSCTVLRGGDPGKRGALYRILCSTVESTSTLSFILY